MVALTILRAAGTFPKPLTKAVSQVVNADGTTGYKISQYNTEIAYFQAVEVPVLNFSQLCETLDRLITDKYSCVIRGLLKEGTPKDYFRRRKTSNKDGGCIDEIDQNWVCLDIDSLPLAALGCSINDAPFAIRALLPTCFAKAACWWSYSPSQGYKSPDHVSIHMWFILDDSMSNAELKSYFTAFNSAFNDVYGVERLVDTITFDSIQIHYTAPPDLIGFSDVLSPRHGTLPGTPSVAITTDWIRQTKLDADTAAAKHLDRCGSDKDGFHSPLLSASAAWVRAYGFAVRTNDEFKTLARDTVARADQSAHTDKIERYTSDTFLDNLLKTAADKGFDKGIPSIDTNQEKFLKGYVFVSMDNCYWHKSTGVVMGVNSFVAVARNEGRIPNAHNVFADVQGTVVSQVMMLPGYEKLSTVSYEGRQIWNKWAGRNATHIKGYDVTPWVEHISFLCDNRPEETETLLNYFAFIIANPGKKVHWAPIIGSEHGGTGKSILKIPLRAIFGRGGVVEISTNDLQSQFNSYMESEMVVVEEVYSADNRSLHNHIKASLTETMVSINHKGVKQYTVPSFANFILFTNHELPFPMDQKDRRFFMVYSEAPPKPQEYYTGMVKWLEGNADAIYSWALDRDLSGFNSNKAPMITAEKAEALENSQPAYILDLKAAAEQATWPLQHDLVRADELAAALNTTFKFHLSGIKIGNALKKAGCQKYPTRPTTKSGSRPVVWSVRNHEAHMKLDGDAVLELMEGKTIGTEKDYYSGGAL